MRRGSKVFEPTSVPLEDNLSVNYIVVGTEDWFQSAFELDAILPEEKLIIHKPADLAPVKEWLDKRKIIGVDTEITGPADVDKSYSLNPVNPDTRIVLLQLGNEEKVWVIDPALINEFKYHLESTRFLHLAHHWLFDFKQLLCKNNIHVQRVYCSMLAEQLLTAGLMGYKVGLADCARRYEPYILISKAVRSLFISLNNGLMSREMLRYAARDVPLLFPVYREQLKAIERQKLNKVAQLEFDIIPCTAEMELGGVYLDTEKLTLLIKYWVERRANMETEILSIYSKRRRELGKSKLIIPEMDEIFDLNSNKDKLEALRKLGITLDDVKRSTLLSVDDPLAKMLGEYSGITKMTSTYGDNMLQKINKTTGLWHPRFAQMGAGASESDAGAGENKDTTATGRYVSDAQQFPRKQERYAKEIDLELQEEVLVNFSNIINQYKEDK